MQSYPFTSLVTYDSDGNPQFDRAVDSEFLRKFYRKDRSNGIVALDNSNSFKVEAYNGMTVKVNAGMCFINGAYAIEDNARELTITSADANQDRIDTIVLRLNDNTSVRAIDLYVIKGNGATIPTPPTLTRNSGIYEIGIANIFIPKNSSAITNERITDTRLDTERCGYSLPLQEIDTTGLYNQLQDQIEKNIELIQSAIDETTAGLLSNKIDAVAEDVNQNTADIVTLNTNLENIESDLKIVDDVVFTPSDNITVATDATRLHRQGNHIYGILRVINTSRRNGHIIVGTLNYAPFTTYPMYCFDGSDRTGNIDIPIASIFSRGEINIRTDSYIEENHALVFAIDFYTN